MAWKGSIKSQGGVWITITLLFFLLIATIVNDARNQIDIYGEDIEVDYRGYEVCVHMTI